jgi:hypothetical protein
MSNNESNNNNNNDGKDNTNNDDPSSNEPGEKLWQMDAEKNFSDYRVIVKRECGNETREITDTYHVHRVFLATGDRKSGYFESMVTGRFSEGCNKCVLTLQDCAAGAFPDLLDYMYELHDNSNCKFQMTSKNAAALFHLADYFQIKPLQTTVTEFIRKDLSIENMHFYCQDAAALNIPSILTAIHKLFIKKLLEITTETPILEVIPPNMLKLILFAKAFVISSEKTKHLGKLVAHYITKHNDKSMFAQIYDADCWKLIRCGIAAQLIAAEESIAPTTNGEGSGPGLKHRIYDTIASRYSEINMNDPSDPCFVFLKTQPSPTVVEIMRRGQIDLNMESLKTLSSTNHTLQLDLVEQKNENQRLQSELRRLRSVVCLRSHKTHAVSTVNLGEAMASLSMKTTPKNEDKESEVKSNEAKQ